jgi:hypothetical protein
MAKLNPVEFVDFFQYRVLMGIPIQIAVESITVVGRWNGPISRCPSDWDYHGYRETEYSLVDRKGYLGDWIRKVITDDDKTLIEERIFERYKERMAYFD